jgi:hypothetical protein
MEIIHDYMIIVEEDTSFKTPSRYCGLITRQYTILTFVIVKSWRSSMFDEIHKVRSLDIIH